MTGTTWRPYTATSCWNTPIRHNAPTHPNSARWISRLAAAGPLTTDPDQFTPAVTDITGRSDVPVSRVRFTGWFSDYTTGTRVGSGEAPTRVLPIPRDVAVGDGDDRQVVILDQVTGVELGLFRFAADPTEPGAWVAQNGYACLCDDTGAGRFSDGLAGRGAGLPYLGGLVRPEEVAAGHIPHALAFGYRAPAAGVFVWPASKTDGRGPSGDLPEGTRIQLDPRLSRAGLRAYGLSDEAVTVAVALQRYGAFLVDYSGRTKLYMQDSTSCVWPDAVHSRMLTALPWGLFRVVTPEGATP